MATRCDPQNPLCQACDTASGAWDARHVVNGNAVYQLPFGLGKPMLNQRGIASAIAGNWELTTTALARTGFPVNVLMPTSYTAPDGASGTQRPDLVPGVSLTPPGGRTVAEWINPAAFAIPAGEFGTAPRNLVRGPGTWQDRSRRRQRHSANGARGHWSSAAEFYNIFNHPQLGQPQATCDLTVSNPTGCPTGFGSIITTVNLNTNIVSDNPGGIGNAARDAVRVAVLFLDHLHHGNHPLPGHRGEGRCSRNVFYSPPSGRRRVPGC